MKRCSECGFSSNSDSANSCEKCGSPLSVSQQNFVPESDLGNAKQTVKGAVPNLPYLDDSSSTPLVVQSSSDCSNCGYSLRSNEGICPNCGFNVGSLSQNPIINKPIINQVQPNKGSTAKLTDFSFLGDNSIKKFQLISEKDGKVLEFEGESISLNRDNLDKSNNTISSSIHAQVSFTDGHWVIEDQSSNQATFVQVSSPTQLEDNTLILIGNKFYRFKAID